MYAQIWKPVSISLAKSLHIYIKVLWDKLFSPFLQLKLYKKIFWKSFTTRTIFYYTQQTFVELTVIFCGSEFHKQEISSMWDLLWQNYSHLLMNLNESINLLTKNALNAWCTVREMHVPRSRSYLFTASLIYWQIIPIYGEENVALSRMRTFPIEFHRSDSCLRSWIWKRWCTMFARWKR